MSLKLKRNKQILEYRNMNKSEEKNPPSESIFFWSFYPILLQPWCITWAPKIAQALEHVLHCVAPVSLPRTPVSSSAIFLVLNIFGWGFLRGIAVQMLTPVLAPCFCYLHPLEYLGHIFGHIYYIVISGRKGVLLFIHPLESSLELDSWYSANVGWNLLNRRTSTPDSFLPPPTFAVQALGW